MSGRLEKLGESICLREFEFDRDYEAVFALWKSAGPGLGIGRSDTPQEIAKKAECDPDLFLVVEQKGAIIAAVMGGFDGRRGMVYHLAVHESFRRQGIGTILMDELENRLRSKGCLKYYLLVKRENLDVVDYYEKRGWNQMDIQILGKELNRED